MSMFLTDEELRELTGYARPSRQAEQLRRQRIPFHLNAAGKPRVARAIIEGRKADNQPATTSWSPAWAGSHR